LGRVSNKKQPQQTKGKDMEEEELFCSVCNRAVDQADEICPSCGSDLIEFEDETPSEKKYKMLMRIRESIKTLMSVLGAALVIGLLYGIFLKDMEIIIYTIIPIINVGMLLIFFELIKVLIDLEQNSRTQTRLLNKLLKNALSEKLNQIS
jgi:hypothetical protein